MNTTYKRISELPYITVILVIINVIIFLICTFTGDLLYNIGEFSPASFLGDNQFYRIVTAMFLHADINHLINNMLLLAGLGAMLEKETGHIMFFLFYILAGLGGQAVSLGYKLFAKEWSVGSIGASGAVFGLVGVLLAMSLYWTRKMANVTWQRIVLVVAYSLYSGYRAANIDNAAHIGGFAAGFLLALGMCFQRKIRERKRNKFVYRDGWERENDD